MPFLRKTLLFVSIITSVALFLSCNDTSPTGLVIPDTYTVTYDGNGHTDGTVPPAMTKTHNIALALASNFGYLVRIGYTFEGWNSAADGSGTDYAEGANYPGNANLALYAKWVVQTYTVTYQGNNNTGGNVPSSQTKTHGVNLTLATNSGNLVRTGSTFEGWNTEADGSGTDYSEGSSYTNNADLTLYAKYGCDALSVFYPNGGEVITAGSELTIQWCLPAAYDQGVIVRISYDAGAEWIVLNLSGAIDPPVNSLTFTIPNDISSNTCLVRVSNYVDESGDFDESDAAFSIVPVILSYVSRDYNGNGYLDAMELTFKFPVDLIEDTWESFSVYDYPNTLGFEIDSMVLSADSSLPENTYIVYLNENWEKWPQTDWIPNVTILPGLAGEYNNIAPIAPGSTLPDFIVKIDGAGPVIRQVIKTVNNPADRSQDFIQIVFSENVSTAEGNALIDTSISEYFVVYDYKGFGVWDTLQGIFDGIEHFVDQTSNSVTFVMSNGNDLLDRYFININASAELIYDNPGTIRNLPHVNNRNNKDGATIPRIQDY